MAIFQDITFHLDPINGSDTARAGFTATAISLGSNTFTTGPAHGLVVGAVVDLTLFTVNGAWVVYDVPNATTFRLQGYSASFDMSGTVTPRGGASWADAWLTPVSGATAARLATGDVNYKTTVKVAHGGVPSSMGVSATLTKQGNTVDLGVGRGNGVDWQVIDQCATAFTAANGSTCSTDATYYKEGSQACTVSRGAGIVTNTKYAYRSLTTLDLSAYTTISFWVSSSDIRPTSAVWTVRLCSDALGDTAVHTFAVPAMPVANTMYRAVFFTGSPLSASINSIAIYSGVLTATTTLRIDNIVASALSGIHHDLLIGAAPPGSEPHTYPVMFPVRALNSGTTLTLDGAVGMGATSSPATARWPFATGTYALLRCGAAFTGTPALATTAMWQLATNTNPTEWVGGWNSLTDVQDFTTIVSINGSGAGLATASSVSCTLSNFSTIGANSAVILTGTGNADVKIDFYFMTGTTTFVVPSLRSWVVEANCVYACGVTTIAAPTAGSATQDWLSTFRILVITNTAGGNVFTGSVSSSNKAFIDFEECIASIPAFTTVLARNGGARILINYRRHQATTAVVTTAGGSLFRIAQFDTGGTRGSTHIKNTTFAVTAVNGSIQPGQSFMLSQRQGVAGTDHWQLDNGFQFEHITPTFPSTDYLWQAAGVGLPYVAARSTLAQAWRLPVATFAVRAGADVTISAAVARTWTVATSIPYHGIVVRGGSVGSISSDLYGPSNAATGVSDVITLVIPAPSVACVIEVDYYVYVATASAGVRAVYLSNITCTQA